MYIYIYKSELTGATRFNVYFYGDDMANAIKGSGRNPGRHSKRVVKTFLEAYNNGRKDKGRRELFRAYGKINESGEVVYSDENGVLPGGLDFSGTLYSLMYFLNIGPGEFLDVLRKCETDFYTAKDAPLDGDFGKVFLGAVNLFEDGFSVLFEKAASFLKSKAGEPGEHFLTIG